MTQSISVAEALPLEKIHVRPLDRIARRTVLKLLSRIACGRIILNDGNNSFSFGRIDRGCPLSVTLTVHHHRFYGNSLFGGTIGAAEAYMAGFWTVDDLTSLLRIFALQPDLFGGMDKGPARLMMPAYRFYHALNKNTPMGSRRNIVAHYDLGNDFYRLFLDETLTYSCGIFEREDATLREASIAKYDRICKKLNLSPDDEVLEIGTGWGGFALHAARRNGCRITTTTISDNQFALAKERVEKEGLGGRITLLKEDYRDLRGQFDKIVSIEMIEAVGHHYFDDYFRACSRLLRPEGAMVLQAITIRDQVFDQHKRSVDFIKRYIFPGSCIPSVTAIAQAVTRATDLRIFHLEDITPHYARTLRLWRENFFRNLDAVKRLGFSDAFIRMWEFYLCYCEAGFAERYLGDVQIVLTKPMNRMAPLVPPLSAAPSWP